MLEQQILCSNNNNNKNSNQLSPPYAKFVNVVVSSVPYGCIQIFCLALGGLHYLPSCLLSSLSSFTCHLVPQGPFTSVSQGLGFPLALLAPCLHLPPCPLQCLSPVLPLCLLPCSSMVLLTDHTVVLTCFWCVGFFSPL